MHHVYTGHCRSQKRPLGPPAKKKKKKSPESPEVVKLFHIGDGNSTISSVRAVRTLKCWAISLASNHRPFKVFFPCYTTELICITSYSPVIHKRYATALFLMQANISHTCLLFPVHRSQISSSNMVSELNSSSDFWHLTPSKRSQHCKCRKGGVIPNDITLSWNE